MVPYPIIIFPGSESPNPNILEIGSTFTSPNPRSKRGPALKVALVNLWRFTSATTDSAREANNKNTLNGYCPLRLGGGRIN